MPDDPNPVVAGDADGGIDAEEPRRIAELAYQIPRGKCQEQDRQRDSLLGQLATTRQITGAMLTVFGAALIIARGPLGGPLAELEVVVFGGISIGLFVLTSIASVAPYAVRWRRAPDLSGFSRDLTRSGYIALLWTLGDGSTAAARANAVSLRRLELLVNIATALQTLSILSVAATVAAALSALLQST